MSESAMNEPERNALAEELLACPFCGSGSVFVRAILPKDTEYVMCSVCHCTTPMLDIGSRKELADIWNRRA